MGPTLGNGKICYVEMPAVDAAASAAFYETVFEWRIRRRGDGEIAFDDAVGQVSGTWVQGRPPAKEGLRIYIMVRSVAQALDAVVANGGGIVLPQTSYGAEIVASFSDPAGNVLGLYQERTLAAS
jgi:predicted enzyme related to lactoylglutathione lyase